MRDPQDAPESTEPLTGDVIRCDACPVLCRIRKGQSGACDRYANVDGKLVRTDPLVVLERAERFWTLILISGRLAIPRDLYEAAAVDGATGPQAFRYITWPALRTLYLTCTILSMIFTLGDFNSVYLLTGGGPADLTHVLSTLGIRYLRLDHVDMSIAAIVVALPFILPLVFYMMKRLSR